MGEKTSLGLDENIEGLLCYLLGIVTGIVFYVLEKDNKFVRFHAVQSMLVFGAILVANIVLIPIVYQVPILGVIVGGLLSALLGIAALVLWVLLMYKAYTGERYNIPFLGEYAEKYS